MPLQKQHASRHPLLGIQSHLVIDLNFILSMKYNVQCSTGGNFGNCYWVTRQSAWSAAIIVDFFNYWEFRRRAANSANISDFGHQRSFRPISAISGAFGCERLNYITSGAGRKFFRISTSFPSFCCPFCLWCSYPQQCNWTLANVLKKKQAVLRDALCWLCQRHLTNTKNVH